MSGDLESNLENLWKQNSELREQLRQDRIDQTARAILAQQSTITDGSVDLFYDSIYEQAEELERARERFVARRTKADQAKALLQRAELAAEARRNHPEEPTK